MKDKVIEVNTDNANTFLKFFCGLAEANAAIQLAFAEESAGDSFCEGVQTTAQGITDCFHYYKFVREFKVNDTIANYEDCPPNIVLK